MAGRNEYGTEEAAELAKQANDGRVVQDRNYHREPRHQYRQKKRDGLPGQLVNLKREVDAAIKGGQAASGQGLKQDGITMASGLFADDQGCNPAYGAQCYPPGWPDSLVIVGVL